MRYITIATGEPAKGRYWTNKNKEIKEKLRVKGILILLSVNMQNTDIGQIKIQILVRNQGWKE